MPYTVKIDSVPAHETANSEKMFPKKWITPQKNNVTDDALKYFLPLIQGNIELKTKNGIPLHFKIQESILS